MHQRESELIQEEQKKERKSKTNINSSKKEHVN